MTDVAWRKLGALIVAALVAASLSAVSAPSAGADPCPVVPNGHWTGTGLTGALVPFTLDEHVTVSPTGVVTGTVAVNGGTPNAMSGTLSCTTLTFGTISPASTFTGTVSLDGRSASGTYTAPGDAGTWTVTADPYMLDATKSVAQPTTIAPGAASTWHIDVENVGTASAIGIQVEFIVSGSGVPGPLNQTSVSQGSGCVVASVDTIWCDIGTLDPGQIESAQIQVVSTGGAGTHIDLDGFASSIVDPGGDVDVPDTVTVSVVAPANLPPGEASGIAQPGVTFSTPGKVSEINKIVVKFKLPKRVAVGTIASGALSPARSKKQRFIDGASLVSYRRGGAKHQARSTKALALGRPRAAMVAGPPVPMSISRISSEAATFCGGAACSGDVIHFTSFSGYNDRKRPAKVTITWDASVRGRGTGSSIYKRGDSVTSPLRTLPTCVKSKLGYTNLPCVSKRKQLGSGDVQFIILMLSGDPKFGRR